MAFYPLYSDFKNFLILQSDYHNQGMIRRRVKRLIFTYTIIGFALFAISACEEDSEILNNMEIKKETENDTSKGSSPGQGN